MKPIIYEPHPVSPERKAELLAEGYKIMDARFAPKDEVTPEVEQVTAFGDEAFDDISADAVPVDEVKPRRGRKRKAH